MKRRRIDEDIFGDSPADTINQKVKGNRNEINAAKWLTRWTGAKFTRTPSSGGLRWKKNSSVCGDVVCEEEDFNFKYSVETKHLARIPVPKNGKLRSNSIFYKIWKQAEEDAERANKKPFVIVRENGMVKDTFYVVTDSYHFGEPLATGWVGEEHKKGIFVYDSEWFINNVKYR